VRRLSSNIVLAFDGDKAGFNASLRAGKIALSLGMDVKVANIPSGVDPADLISKNGVDAWREAIRNSKHLIEFLLNKVLIDAKGDNRKIGREIKDKILPFVDAIESSIEQMHFIKKISDESGVPEGALKEDLKKVGQELKVEKREIEEIKKNESQIFRKDYIERRLLGIILWQKTLTKQSIDAEKILQDLASISKIDGKVILEKTENNKEDLIFEAEVFYGSDVDLLKDVSELLINLEEEYLKEELSKKMHELYIYKEKKENQGEIEVLKEINEINKKIQNIKNGRLKKP
jgi:DNA primase